MLGGFPSLLFSEAWSGSIGGGLAIGGVRVGFVSGLDGFALLGRCVARVSRLGEDEGELESTTYCTCVRAICSNLPMTPDFLALVDAPTSALLIILPDCRPQRLS